MSHTIWVDVDESGMVDQTERRICSGWALSTGKVSMRTRRDNRNSPGAYTGTEDSKASRNVQLSIRVQVLTLHDHGHSCQWYGAHAL